MNGKPAMKLLRVLDASEDPNPKHDISLHQTERLRARVKQVLQYGFVWLVVVMHQEVVTIL
jgi:hypothetical protein